MPSGTNHCRLQSALLLHRYSRNDLVSDFKPDSGLCSNQHCCCISIPGEFTPIPAVTLTPSSNQHCCCISIPGLLVLGNRVGLALWLQSALLLHKYSRPEVLCERRRDISEGSNQHCCCISIPGRSVSGPSRAALAPISIAAA